ncbi:hypothetical protein [Mesorhizobium kowhaii]|uniref:Replication protein n=1 Tax=Mesorhizobium kowhaii TaxID=1300272 RepID=A0A2W7CSV4_9HYPH|nr:hypothetical protein [Mesorhizobium kowhaii]PZV39743.1 hypothetical protein B5V02_07385 [Mesorhizobium kowhaii]
MSKREFSKVSPALWRSKRFLALPKDRCRLLLVFYMTCGHQTSAGCYRISEGYACSDLGWLPEDYRTARDPLVECGLIAFDNDTEEVFVSGWFRFCPPMNPKHAAGTMALIADIESDRLREQAEQEFAPAYTALQARSPRLPGR